MKTHILITDKNGMERVIPREYIGLTGFFKTNTKYTYYVWETTRGTNLIEISRDAYMKLKEELTHD
jgi:hypothetical protein